MGACGFWIQLGPSHQARGDPNHFSATKNGLSEERLEQAPPTTRKPEGEEWIKVVTGRRGGKDSQPKCPPSANDNLKTSSAHQLKQAHHGSTTTGRVCTEDGSPRSALTSSRPKTPPQPKPSDTPEIKKNLDDLMKGIKEIIQEADEHTNADILKSINEAANAMAKYFISVLEFGVCELEGCPGRSR